MNRIFFFSLDSRIYVRYNEGMEIGTETDVAALIARVRVVNRHISRATAEKLRLIARIDQLLNADGTNGRVSAAAVAGTSKCSAAQAAGEVALARKLAELPAVSEAFCEW